MPTFAPSLPPESVLFGNTPDMLSLHERIVKFAPTNVPVLIQGESGTGKDLIAQLIHRHSLLAHKPIIRVNCPAIPHTLIESELFGYEQGAFTGANAARRGRVEAAHGATLFLDEIAEFGISAQPKLLHLLQDGSFCRVGGDETRRVNLRLLSASHRDLKKQVEKGEFRADLFFRINAVTIELAPLRKRIADLPHLIAYFMDRYQRAFRQIVAPLSPRIIRVMQKYHWPGNIRELENVIRSYVAIGDEERIASELLMNDRPESGDGFALPDMQVGSLKEITKGIIRQVERHVILKALKANDWNRKKTAKALKMSYRSLLYKLNGVEVSPDPGGDDTAPQADIRQARAGSS